MTGNDPLPFPALPVGWNYGLSRTNKRYYFWQTGSRRSVFEHPTSGKEYTYEGEQSNKENIAPSFGFTDSIINDAVQSTKTLDGQTLELLLNTLACPSGLDREDKISKVQEALGDLTRKLQQHSSVKQSRIHSANTNELAALCLALRLDHTQPREKLIENLIMSYKQRVRAGSMDITSEADPTTPITPSLPFTSSYSSLSSASSNSISNISSTTSTAVSSNYSNAELPFPSLPSDWCYSFSQSYNKYYFWQRGSETSDFSHPLTGLHYEGPNTNSPPLQRTSSALNPDSVSDAKSSRTNVLVAMGWNKEVVEDALKRTGGDIMKARGVLYQQKPGASESNNNTPEALSAREKVNLIKKLNNEYHTGSISPDEYNGVWSNLFGSINKMLTQSQPNINTSGSPPITSHESNSPIKHSSRPRSDSHSSSGSSNDTSSIPIPVVPVSAMPRTSSRSSIPQVNVQSASTQPQQHSPPPSVSNIPKNPAAVVGPQKQGGVPELPLSYGPNLHDPAPYLNRGVSMNPPLPRPPLCLYTTPPLQNGLFVSPPEGEPVTKYNYNFRTKQWTTSQIYVRIDMYPFQEGTLRIVFHMKDLSQPFGPRQDWVVKISKDPAEPNQTYFLDCEMQALAGYFGEEYNKMNPPKLVQFLEASVIECHSRINPFTSMPVVFAVEPFVQGEYIKHTNNYGWVSPLDRNTPQAFSHFTHYLSNGMILVADIQGVSEKTVDRYTDPQIHSRGNLGFGKGNLGGEGIHQFFVTHKCNSICKSLRLPILHQKHNDHGTRVAGSHLADPDFVPPPPNPQLLHFALSKQQVDHMEARWRALQKMHAPTR